MSNQQKKNTFYGAAAILTVSTILVKIIGAIFKIPLIAILPEEAYGDFNGAYNIYSFFLTISTAGLPVALSKTVSECHTLGRILCVPVHGAVQLPLHVSVRTTGSNLYHWQ